MIVQRLKSIGPALKFFSAVIPLLLLANTLSAEATVAFAHITRTTHNMGKTAVTTFHNDNARTGQNINETILNTRNVNSGQFGKIASYSVDGQIYAQPLVLPNVTIKGAMHDVVYVATEHDSVYAFDANEANGAKLLWHTSFIHAPASTTVPSTDLYTAYPHADISPEVGITGTPVIDASRCILYVVAMTKESGHYIQRLHALDTTTGHDMPGSPLKITASVPGSGVDSVKNVVSFNPLTANQRPALLLLNGNVYIGWSSYGESGLYHGWIMGYRYTSAGLQQIAGAIYNDTPDGEKGGIWMGGSGMAADDNGNIYFTSDDGTFDRASSGVDAAGTFAKMDTHNGLKFVDYFTPFNTPCLSPANFDIGSSGVVLLPDQDNASSPHVLIGSGKEGRIYVVNRDNMGKFTSDRHLNCSTAEQSRTNIDKIVQELPPQTDGSLFGVAGYWGGTAQSGQIVYFDGFTDHLRAFQLKDGMLANSVSSPETYNFSGATPSISSNGSQAGTGIVWVTGSSSCSFPGCTPKGPGVLRAYDATNVSKELYSSDDNAARDQLASYIKFSVPTVANGEVFVGTQNSLDIFGLLHN